MADDKNDDKKRYNKNHLKVYASSLSLMFKSFKKEPEGLYLKLIIKA